MLTLEQCKQISRLLHDLKDSYLTNNPDAVAEISAVLDFLDEAIASQ